MARRVAHAGSAARRHKIGFRKRARVAQDGAAYGFRDVGGVVVALDQPPETRLQIRRAGNDDVREPIKVHRPSERLPVHARVPRIQHVILVLPVTQARAYDLVRSKLESDEVAGEKEAPRLPSGPRSH